MHELVLMAADPVTGIDWRQMVWQPVKDTMFNVGGAAIAVAVLILAVNFGARIFATVTGVRATLKDANSESSSERRDRNARGYS